MSLRVWDRLSQLRRCRFVGRTGERALFHSVLRETQLPWQLLYIFGPGGIGKTTLLQKFAFICEQAKTPVIYIDARNIEPTPDSFLSTLHIATGCIRQDSLIEKIAEHLGHYVILIDTYETLTPLEAWLREIFLLQLPQDALVVLAGRQPPDSTWRTDPGWQALIHTISLRNLSPQESQTYLNKRQIPAQQHQAVLNFTHGHSLALSLVADVFAQRGDIHFRPEDAPDVVKTLLEQFVQELPSPVHRAALEIGALVRLTTEALLAETLRLQDAYELFQWLRGLSFIESGASGLFPPRSGAGSISNRLALAEP